MAIFGVAQDLDFGAGIASGVETIGLIGFEKCWDYSVIGSATNLASRFCDEATKGQILISDRFYNRDCAGKVKVEAVGSFNLKGIEVPVKVHNVLEITK